MNYKDRQLLEEAYLKTRGTAKPITESAGGMVYVAYGDNSRGGIEIFGLFPSEEAAEQAIMDKDGSYYPGDDNYVQIVPLPMGVYHEEPILKSHTLGRPGTKVTHPPTGSR